MFGLFTEEPPLPMARVLTESNTYYIQSSAASVTRQWVISGTRFREQENKVQGAGKPGSRSRRTRFREHEKNAQGAGEQRSGIRRTKIGDQGNKDQGSGEQRSGIRGTKIREQEEKVKEAGRAAQRGLLPHIVACKEDDQPDTEGEDLLAVVLPLPVPLLGPRDLPLQGKVQTRGRRLLRGPTFISAILFSVMEVSSFFFLLFSSISLQNSVR